MPASRPRASFEPIPPDLNVVELVEETPNFQFCDRVSIQSIEEYGFDQFEKLVVKHCIIGGKPLVIDGFEERLDAWTFTPKWLGDNCGTKVENVRDITNKKNEAMTIRHYLNHMGPLTEQFFDSPDNYKQKNRQRMYLKDIDCPQVWHDKLRDMLPGSVFYWNDSTGEASGFGAADSFSAASGIRKSKGIAIAGDLMSSLPHQMRADNLMCYIGHEGTFTPAHREMCATMGHNIMVHASRDVDETGQAERPGSSIWFMTENKDRDLVAEWWLSKLGHDIELEDHFAQIAAWQTAPFKTYVVEQRVGDFILIPPLAPHQVWNRGSRTMKVAWNRTTIETLEMALHEALPNSRLVCRDEQYKNKAIIYHTLMKYSGLIKRATELANRSDEFQFALWESKKYRQLEKDFKRLFELYKEILLSEMFAPGTKESCEYVEFDSTVTCSYCRGNILNRFLTCKSCKDKFGGEDEYDMCMDCYVMGRSCECRSKYKWVEQFKWKHLLERYEYWRSQIIQINGGMTGKTPYPLEEERRLTSKKSLAQICQEQLQIRPFHDIKAVQPPSDPEESEDEVHLNADGTIKKVVKKKPRNFNDKNKSCHSCLKRHPKWKMAMCTMCERYWCYGALYRAYDLMPKDIMEDPLWECPHCRKICRTGACSQDHRQHPYQPKLTLLGHDTKKVADVRSVECLVDFGVSNLYWTDGTQLQRLAADAEQSRLNQAQEDGYEDIDDLDGHAREHPGGITYSPKAIDPTLGGAEAGDMPYPHALANEEMQAYDQIGDTSQMSVYPDLDQQSAQQAYGAQGLYQVDDQDEGSKDATPNGQNSKKRRHVADADTIKVVHPKAKRRKGQQEEEKDKQPVRNKASKQFQVEQNRKQLDKARREDRYLFVWAKLNKKSLLVTLQLPQDKLRDFKDREAANQANSQNVQHGSTVLLRSDIAPPPVHPKTTSEAVEKPKVASYRARVEEDDDFRARRRGQRPGHKPKQKPKYEEITVDDDLDDDLFVQDNQEDRLQRSQRRKSDWLSRRHEGEEDFPDELPENWVDRGKRKRNAEPSSEPSSARRAFSQKMPSIRPIGNAEPIDLTNEADNSDTSAEYEDAIDTAEDIPSALGEYRPESANLIAKLAAAELADKTSDELMGSASMEPSSATVTTSSVTKATPGSLASKLNGRRVKIVSVTSKRKFIGKGGPPGRTSLP